jgi:putative phage-type endonuclease
VVVAVVTRRQITEQAVEVVPAGAPRDVWLAARQHGIGASEAAAVLGLSPWESAFSLHWRKRGVLGGVDETEPMRWGTILEAPIAAEFARRHPTVRVERVGLCAHVDRPWQLATPDRLIVDPDEGCDCPAAGCRRTGVCTAGGAVTAVVECKIDDAHHAYAWGEEGSDDIPPSVVRASQPRPTVTALSVPPASLVRETLPPLVRLTATESLPISSFRDVRGDNPRRSGTAGRRP